VTILAPVYVTPGIGDRFTGGLQWVTLDVSGADDWITRLAAARMSDFLRRSATLDSRPLWRNWRWMLAGVMSETAYAIHHGLHLEELERNAGKADFTHHGKYVDVKTTTSPTGAWLSVKVDALDRMHEQYELRRCVIAGAQTDIDTGHVTLMGQRPCTYMLDDYDVNGAETGHQYAYLRIPFRDFTPFGAP